MSGTQYICNMPHPTAPMADPETGVPSIVWWNWAQKIFSRTGGDEGASTTAAMQAAQQAQAAAVAAQTAANDAQAAADTAQTAADTAQAAADAANAAVASLAAQVGAPGQLTGTATNDDAAAGKVGEYVSSSIPIGSEVALTSGVTANVTSISLTAGDWDVAGSVAFDPDATTTISSIAGAISTTSATIPTAPAGGASQGLRLTFTVGASQQLQAGQVRLSLGTTTTVFLVATAVFGVSTMGVYGFIGARRRR